MTLDDDWDGFGQKLTGSGKTIFADVAVAPEDLYDLPERGENDPYLYGFTFHQVYLTTIISGIVTRILHDALALVRSRSRNFYHALAEKPADEPEIQAVIGRIAAYRAAILGTVDRAIAALDLAWARETSPEAGALSIAASIAAAEAKVVTDEVAANLAGLLLDVGSGSAVSTSKALDRHWRNLKVIAAHNPRIYKERVLGDHYLNGALPPTGAFF
ncbi:acyl-CoA dehydrogenase family protein [Tianweitania sp.]|uniref:acyl-CoA dehydrogenase family protein n=1 Tax=Tianweitania sp. TaxID=2021634 RepID=UPI0028A222CC|nr:acyl-CoA dehydrogenase family protein [Tianweitania sp.]